MGLSLSLGFDVYIYLHHCFYFYLHHLSYPEYKMKVLWANHSTKTSKYSLEFSVMTLQETKYSSSEFHVFLQKNKFAYIVSTIVEFVTCCSLVVLFLPKSLLHSTNYWTLLPLQYLFFFSVIINTNLGATFRYLKPNNSAMSLH